MNIFINKPSKKVYQNYLINVGKESKDIVQEYSNGVKFKIQLDDKEESFALLIHPHDHRLFMAINLNCRQYFLLDIGELRLIDRDPRTQSINRLQKKKYFIVKDLFYLIFLFDSVQLRERRFYEIEFLKRKYKEQYKHHSQVLDSQILKLFVASNQDLIQHKFIEIPQIQDLLDKLRIKFSKDELKEYLVAISATKQLKLTCEQLQILLKMLSLKYQLVPVFQKYHPGFHLNYQSKFDLKLIIFQPLMTKKQFTEFLYREQSLIMNEIIHAVQLLNWHDDKISFYQFTRYLYHSSNLAIHPQKTKLYQNMNHPLTQYFVYSSHNTYLSGNQLTSSSEIWRYAQDLYNGLRCLQIDIHDSNQGPIVKHGFTLTKKIMFQEVIKVINEFSLLNEGHSPIILSFEVHCNSNNQKKIAKIVHQHFADRLYQIPLQSNNLDRFPSFDKLRNKIIIQGTGSIIHIRPNIYKFDTSNLIKRPNPFGENSDDQEIQKPKQVDEKKLPEHSLMEIYSIFVNDVNIHQTCWQMGNLSEVKMKSIAKSKSSTDYFKSFTNKCWNRVYPKGTRFGSSNYNPIQFYEMGAQLVSLNTQHADIYSYVMTGMFFENGYKKSGFILKPDSLRTNHVIQFSNHSIQIEILAVQNISNEKNEFPKNLKVQVAFVGASDDMKIKGNEGMTNLTQKLEKVSFHTRVLSSKSVTYHFKNFYFANIFFTIDDCGSISIPVRMLRTGYRLIQLLNHSKEEKQYSYILAHINIK